MTNVEALLLSISGFTGLCAMAALWKILDDCKKRELRRKRQRELYNVRTTSGAAAPN